MTRRVPLGLGALMLSTGLAAPPEGGPPGPPPPSAFEAAGAEAAQDLVILGQTRPILLRLRLLVGGQPYRRAWAESVRKTFASVDRDGDGKLDAAEATAGALGPLLGARGGVPKELSLTPDGLAEALREPAGPLQVRAVGLADRRTDALFDLLDRDRDGRLDRVELATILGSLRRLDFDDDEAIGVEEIALGDNAPASAAPAMATPGRPARPAAASPVVIELEAGEVPLRLARLVLKKYDVGAGPNPGRPDSRLSPEEFAIEADEFSRADLNADGKLDAEDVRRHLAEAPRAATLDVALGAEPSGRPVARVRPARGEGPPKGLAVRQVSESVVEVEVGPIRLDIHAVDDPGVAESARKALVKAVEAADANQDGYLEASELAPANNNQPAPLAALFQTLDRDGDGKVYPRDAAEYAAIRSSWSRDRLILTGSDEGRSLFGLLDLDRDRRLGAREVLGTSARIAACDRDGDGRVAPEEVPHHIQLTLARGEESAPGGPAAPTAARSRGGPDWFRRMDSNGDGDVSRREFLGSREQFDRLDRDRDGLVGPGEAEAVRGPGG